MLLLFLTDHRPNWREENRVEQSVLYDIYCCVPNTLYCAFFCTLGLGPTILIVINFIQWLNGGSYVMCKCWEHFYALAKKKKTYCAISLIFQLTCRFLFSPNYAMWDWWCHACNIGLLTLQVIKDLYLWRVCFFWQCFYVQQLSHLIVEVV